jgi:cytoskeletal protein CcmA (bactofilin family)
MSGVALLLALVIATPPAEARPDSARIVTKVRIDDQGVKVAEGGSEQAGDTIVVGGVRRHRTVRVRGPMIIVDGDSDGLVRVFADAEVPAGEQLDGDVVAVFGSVDVTGSVTGDAVAVFGSVRLAPGATVDGDVVAVGGVIDHAEGATVGGQSVSLGFLPTFGGLPALPVLLLSIAIGWLLTLFVAWLLTMIFPDRLQRIAATATRHTTGSFFLGVLSMPLFVLALALLFITVIGIPLAFLLPLVYVGVVWAGQVAASYVLGCKLTGRRIGEASPMLPIATAGAFVALFFVVGAVLSGPPGISRSLGLFFSLLGVLLVAGLSAIGTGAFLLSLAGTRSGEVPDALAPPAGSAPLVPPTPGVQPL